LIGVALLWPTASAHAKPYQQPKGWYTIELPEGMQPKKSDDPLGLNFENKKGDGWFRLQVLPGNSNIELLTAVPLTAFQKMMPNAAPDGEPQNFTIGGHPARWLVYRGTMVTGGNTQPLVGIGGAVAFPNGGVVLISGLVPQAHAQWGEAIAAAFRTLHAGPTATETAAPTPSPSVAAGTQPAVGPPVHYEEPGGLYAIDLPPGFSARSSGSTTMRFESAGGDGWFQLTPVPASNDLEVVAGATKKVLDRLVANATIADGPKDLAVNGRPARWVVYRGTMTAGEVTQLTVGLGGSLSLPKCGVMLVAMLGPTAYDKWGAAISTSFRTLRAGSGPGAAQPAAPAPVASAGAAPPAAPGPASASGAPAGTVTQEAFGATSTVNADGSTTFKHPAGSFDLPAGWRVGKPTGDLTFAQFDSPHGGSLSFMIGPRGYRSSKAMCQGVEAQIHRGAPQFKIQPPGHYEVDSQRNNKVTLARYQGPMAIEGRELDGRGLTAWGKGQRGLIVGIGIAIGEMAAADIDDMEKIARTLR
jgi:hypothetical protein